MFIIKFKDIKSFLDIGLYFSTNLVTKFISYNNLNYLFKN
jgi:hypothetical protein